MAIAGYGALAGELGPAQFAARFPHLFLLLSHESAAEGEGAIDVLSLGPKTAGEPVAVGRHPACQVVLARGSVGLLHAEVRRAPDGGWLLVDHGSPGGTYLGSARLEPGRPVPLASGDLVTLGDVRARVVDALELRRVLLRLTEAAARIAGTSSFFSSGGPALGFGDPLEPPGGAGSPARPPEEAVPDFEETSDVSERSETRPLTRADLVGGRYQLVERLGEGAMGTVWRALHRDLGKPVAVKVIRPGLFDRSEGRELFFREARTASSLLHANVVSVTDFGIDRLRGPFVVMELLEGRTLREHLAAQGRLALDRAFAIFQQLLAALSFVHGKGVIHCDIKPENLFLSERSDERGPHLQILDFGLAAAGRGVDLGKSRPGAAGTLPYIAPERLFSGKSPSAAADLYSAGAVLYEMLTGRPTHRAENVVALASLVVGTDPAPPADLGPDATGAVALTMSLLARDPAARPASAALALAEVRRLAAELGWHPSEPARRAPPAAASGSSTLGERLAFPVAVTDAQGRIQAFNPAFLRLSGGTSAALVGRPVREVIQADRLQSVIEGLVAARGDATAWIRLPDGNRLSLARVLGPAGSEIHLVWSKPPRGG